MNQWFSFFWRSHGRVIVPLLAQFEERHISQFYAIWSERVTQPIHFLRNATPLAILQELQKPTLFTKDATFYISSRDDRVDTIELSYANHTYRATETMITCDSQLICARCFMFGHIIPFGSEQHIVPRTTLMSTMQKFKIDVDEDASLFLKEYSWWMANGIYPKTSKTLNGVLTSFQMSRFLLGVINDKQELVVDHINHLPSDQRLCNMRLVTPRINSQNRVKIGKSCYKGVTQTEGNKWKAKSSGYYLGTYNSAEEAAFAYNTHVRNTYPPGAALNNVPEPSQGLTPIERPKAQTVTMVVRKRKGLCYRAVRRENGVLREKRFESQLDAEKWANSASRSSNKITRAIGTTNARQQGWQIYSTGGTVNGETRFLVRIHQKHARPLHKTFATITAAKEWILTVKPDALFDISPTLCDHDNFYLEATGGKKVQVDESVAIQYRGHHLSFNGGGYPCVRLNGKVHQLHRLIMNAQEGQIVDHHNRDKLCCLRSNLEFVTRSENSYNCPKRKHSTSSFFNVHVDGGKFRVTHNCNNRKIDGGCYDNEQVAAFVADQIALQYRGKRAKLNQVSCPVGWKYDAFLHRGVQM